jgi:hypothetical protein
MRPNEISPPSPDSEVWRRFVGMFGGDAVERKYGKTVPPEWSAMLSRLKQYEIDRGVRRLAYSGKAHVPALPEFVKLCRMIGDEVDEGPRPIQLLAPPEENPWIAEGNQHLRSHLNTQLATNSQRYGKPASYEAMKDPKRADDKNLDASPEFVRNVHTLVAYKNRWTEMMMNADAGQGVPIDEQQEIWDECMRLAEAEIANS